MEFNWWLVIPLLIVSAPYLWSRTLSVRQWFKNRFLPSIFLSLYQRIAKVKSTMASFVICDTNRSACITFEHLGRNLILFAPYEVRSKVKMSQHRIFIVKQGFETEYIHPAGVPFLVTPNQLGAEKVIVRHKNTNQVVKTIIGDDLITI